MALKELLQKNNQQDQPMFPGFELAEVVRELARVEAAKRERNEEWNIEIKSLKKRMFRLADEMKGKKGE